MLWRIAVTLGKLYKASGRHELADEAFSRARTIIEELAASVPNEALRDAFLHLALLQIPSPPLRPTARQTLSGLTTREVEVLRLVAQGLTDAQVAEHLVISPRTVNWHLTSIYSKLGVSSRAAATRYAIDHKLV